MSSVWDYCVIDTATTTLIQNLENCSEINNRQISSIRDAPSSSGALSSKSAATDQNVVNSMGDPADESGIDGLQASLVSSELSCRSFMVELDSLLHTLGEVAALHDDVTGRTNSLMFNCENLLEQQHSLQSTVDVLKTTLAPFNDVEGVAGLLGIPFDARGLPTKANEKSAQKSEIKAITDSFNIDPRAPEFKDVLIRLSTALKSLKGVNFLDSERYHRWLVQLQCRAASLVARAMRELLEGAASSCTAPPMKRGMGTGRGDGPNGSDRNKRQPGGTETPLESNPIYAKFRGLGFRMRELSALLKIATPRDEFSTGNVLGGSRMVGNGMYQSATPSGGDSFLKSEQDVMYETKENYITLRTQLLLPFVLDSCTVTAHNPISTSTSTSTTEVTSKSITTISTPPLCPIIRHAYSTLFRVAQMEVQLFDSLFVIPDNDIEHDSNSNMNHHMKLSNKQGSGEVVSIIESICNATSDYLRPLIIHENNVEELCRVINTLSEDIKAQIDGLFPSYSKPSSSSTSNSSTTNINKNNNKENSKNLLKTLNKGLNKTICDAQERLSYCSEITMRVEVQFFEPLPSQLSYPGIIEIHEEKRIKRAAEKSQKNKNKATTIKDGKDEEGNKVNNDEEIGSEKIRINGGRSVNNGEINGDLFLIRHLLILREQLIPFNIKLQKKNLNLDFQPSQKALNYFVMNNMKNIINFNRENNNHNNDNSSSSNNNDNYNNDGTSFSSNVGNNSTSYFYNNSFFLLAREGLPAIIENEIFIKKDLDLDLKNACQALKDSVLKKIFGNMDVFLTKIIAFVGDFSNSSLTSSNSNGNNMPNVAYANSNSTSDKLPALSNDARENLKKLDFMKVERVRDMLVNVQENVVLTAPDFMNSMKLYVENSVARSIILRPLLQEINSVHRKMECVISSCFDPGSTSRELEQQLLSIINVVMSELSY